MARSLPRCPGTVTNPRFAECLNLPMAAARTRLVPTIRLEQSNDIPYLHGFDASPLHSALHNDQAQPRTSREAGWPPAGAPG